MSLIDLPQAHWVEIAHDLAMLTVPVDGATVYTPEDIAKNHKLSTQEFQDLLNTQSFQDILEGELRRIKNMGEHAGVRLRAEAMATALQENLFQRAVQGELDDKLAVQLLGMLLKSAGLEQPPEVLKAQEQSNVVNIAFNVPKIHNPKLKHIINQPQVNVVEAEATPC